MAKGRSRLTRSALSRVYPTRPRTCLGWAKTALALLAVTALAGAVVWALLGHWWRAFGCVVVFAHVLLCAACIARWQEENRGMRR